MDQYLNKVIAYKPILLGWLVLQTHNVETAKDLYHDLFIRVYEKLAAGKYTEKGQFKQWVFLVMRNLTMDYFRKQNNQRRFEVDPHYLDYYGKTNNWLNDIIPDGAANAETQLIKAEQTQILRRAVGVLKNPEFKAIIMAHYYGEKKFKDIAEQTGIGLNTLLGQNRYAKRDLKKFIEKENNTML